MFPLVFNWCWHCMGKLRWSLKHCCCAQESKVRETDCAVCAMKAALFLILYRQLRCSRPLTNTVMRSSDRTQHASLLHKHRSVQCSTTHSIRQLQYDSLGSYTNTGAGWMFRGRVRERVPSASAAAGAPELPGGARHARGQTVWSAGQRHWQTSTWWRHPKQWHTQLSTALTQLMWAALVKQPVLQSELGAAAPVRSQAAHRHSVWLEKLSRSF